MTKSEYLSSDTFIRELKETDHFGEIAFVEKCPRSMNVIAESENVKLIAMCKNLFHKILPDIEIFLKMDYKAETAAKMNAHHEQEGKHLELGTTYIY